MSAAPQDYQAFLAAKVAFGANLGFEVPHDALHPWLKPHAAALALWALRKGRAAIFASFGLHKTSIQLEVSRIVAGDDKRSLIVAPLGVRQEFRRDADQLGIPIRFIRTTAEVGGPGVYVTNYESARDEKLDMSLFESVSLDEAAVLRGFGGTKTFRSLMKLFEGTRYRFVATATPSPNEYIELLAYAAFLGVMDVGQSKTRWFKRDSQNADKLTLHAHKAREFYLWVASWAIFVDRPSDLMCRCRCKESNSRVNGSGTLSSPNGEAMENGRANAIAVDRDEQALTISSMAELSVADASASSMEERELQPTPRGGACGTDAQTRETRTGQTTAAGEFPCVQDGNPSPHSLPTWESRQPAQLSSGATIAGTTSRGIAAGPADESKPGTLADPSPSLSKGGRSLFPHGLKNSAQTTGSCTPDIGSGGHPSGCSQACAEGGICPYDIGYVMPDLDVHWHEVPSDHSQAGQERDGQGRLLRNAAIGVSDAAAEKRSSMDARIAKMMELRAIDPSAHRVLWHDLEDERRAIEAAVSGVTSIYGSQPLPQREAAIMGFADGQIQEIAGKPSMIGAGTNLQRHCAWSIYLGIGFKFYELVQSIHRLQRFGQTRPVRIDLIYTEAEREVRRTLEAKWKRHIELVARMREIVREYGLGEVAFAQALSRSMGVTRQEASGSDWRLIQNDCVVECAAGPENSVGLIVTSIPFATQYEYTPTYNDFGHTDDNEHFWRQMDFLTPSLLRMLQPGRVMAVHVKDRIVPGGINGLGFQTLHPFHAEAIDHYRQHGFALLGMKTITTDVVRENNQTYRLGWTEQCKDGTRMGCGVPEYVLLLRKPPTDPATGYADAPVLKDKPHCRDDDGNVAPFDKRDNWKRPVPGTGYSRAAWQLDAHGFTRSSGNRLLSAEELANMPHEQLYKWWEQHSTGRVYDYADHKAICERLDEMQRLPATFMLFPPHSIHPDVWSDVTRMRTLNAEQHARGREMHLCPLQFDIVDRLIVQHSMPGEVVFDPFAGIGTVPLRALKLGRVGWGIELSASYWRDAVRYCEAAEAEAATPTLFDLLDAA